MLLLFLYELFQILLFESRQREFENIRFTRSCLIIEYDRIAVDMGLKHIQGFDRICKRYDIGKGYDRYFDLRIDQK